MAVIVLCQIASYWKMMGLRGKKAESTARFMTEEVEASEDRGCVSHVCCFFDVTFDGEPGGRIIFLLYDKKVHPALKVSLLVEKSPIDCLRLN